MKTDARVRYTQMIIKKTFIQLLKEKPVRQITVKEICEKSEINRTTFYKHYMDVYDLLERVEDEAADSLVNLINKYGQADSEKVTLIICREIYKYQDELKEFFRKNQDTDILYKIAVRCFLNINEGRRDEDRFLSDPMNFGAFAGAIGGVIGYWTGSGMKESPQEIAQAIHRYTEGLMGK